MSVLLLSNFRRKFIVTRDLSREGQINPESIYVKLRKDPYGGIFSPKTIEH